MPSRVAFTTVEVAEATVPVLPAGGKRARQEVAVPQISGLSLPVSAMAVTSTEPFAAWSGGPAGSLHPAQIRVTVTTAVSCPRRVSGVLVGSSGRPPSSRRVRSRVTASVRRSGSQSRFSSSSRACASART